MTGRPLRIPLRQDAELDDASSELLELSLQPGAPPAEGLVRTGLWNPGLWRRWMPYGARLLGNGKLSDRIREICILRVAVQTRSDYEWSQHVVIGRGAGLTDDEMHSLAGDGAADWSVFEAAVIDAVDELGRDAVISAATWEKLAQHLERDQLVELPMLVGAYTGLAYLLNSVGTPVEPGLDGLPDNG